MKIGIARAALTAALCTLLVSCAAQSSGPDEAVREFYDLLNAGRYTEAKQMYGAEALEVLHDPTSVDDDAFRQWAESETKNGTITEVSIVSSEVEADSANVRFELTYGDGTKKSAQVPVALENGAWRLGLIG